MELDDFDSAELESDLDEFDFENQDLDEDSDEDSNETNNIKPKQKRISHHYTDELELKSLLIRLKNTKIITDNEQGIELRKDEYETLNLIKENQYDERLNSYINNDIKRYIKIKRKLKDIDQTQTAINQKERIREIQDRLKNRIIQNSEITLSDKRSEERLGEIVILMVKNILRKPNFQHEDYHEDFYSDQSYKIFHYMRTFDHTKISPRTGYQVNQFQYISQIIHNSILFVLNQRKKESEKITEFYTENPQSNIQFQFDDGSDEELFHRLRKICPLEFPFEIQDSYPFIIKDLLQFIETEYSIEDEETILERILDYQETSKLGPVLVGDQIRSDEYLVKFIEKSQQAKKLQKEEDSIGSW